MDWEKNEWQGRRKDQVEFSSKVVFYSLIVGVVIILFGLLSNIF